MTEPPPPKLQPHHPGYRSWTSSWYDADGKRRRKRFGKERETTRVQAMALYNRWRGNGSGQLVDVVAIDQLAAAYLAHAGDALDHSPLLADVESAMAFLRSRAGASNASTFTGREVRQIRDAMLLTPRPVNEANRALAIIKEMFRWAVVDRGLIPDAVAVAASLVAPLRRAGASARAAAPDVRAHLKSVLCEAVEMSSDRLNHYIDLAGVKRPTRGRRDHRYSSIEARLILTEVMRSSPTEAHRVAAAAALQSRAFAAVDERPASAGGGQ